MLTWLYITLSFFSCLSIDAASGADCSRLCCERAQSVQHQDMAAVPLFPCDCFLCSLLKIKVTLKEWELWEVMSSVHILVSGTMKTVKTNRLFFWSSHLLLSHLQLKNATPDGASGQFQGYVSSFSHLIIFLHGENSQILFLLLFISKNNILAWADFVWQLSVPCEFFILEL